MITLCCVHCMNPISTCAEINRYVHDATWSVACDVSTVTGPRAEPNLDGLVTDATAALDERYWLIYVDRSDDGLSARQIQALLDGLNPCESDEFAAIEEYESLHRWQASEDILRELLGDDLRDLLDGHDRLEQIREVIYERDQTDLIIELRKASPSSLFRYDLDVDVPDYTMSAHDRADTCQQIITAAGLNATDQRTVEHVYGLIDEASYGGRLYVLWSTDPDQAIELAEPVAWDEHGTALTELCGTVTFTNAHLLILDKWNGSGHEIEVPTITAQWRPHRVAIDSPRVGHGYSWTEVACPTRSAYQATYTLDRPIPQKIPA
jgi:hypothetical protein